MYKCFIFTVCSVYELYISINNLCLYIDCDTVPLLDPDDLRFLVNHLQPVVCLSVNLCFMQQCLQQLRMPVSPVVYLLDVQVFDILLCAIRMSLATLYVFVYNLCLYIDDHIILL